MADRMAISKTQAGAALIERNVGFILAGLTLAAAALAPLILPATYLNYGVKMMVAGLFAMAFNVLWSQARLLSFGHAAYFALGGFAVIHVLALGERQILNVPTPLVPLAGLAAGALAGFIVGYFATIRTGTYFAMITLALGELLYSIAPKWQGMFGGEAGLSSMRMPWGGLTFGSATEVYLSVLLWTLVGLAILWWIARTPFGQIAIAVGDNERRLQFLGYRTHILKTLIFTISAAGSGLAGGLLAFSMESASFELFAGSNSAMPVIQTFLGGAGVFLGPFIGGAGLTLFAELASDATRLWLLYLGIMFVVLMLYSPDGLAGVFVRHLSLDARAWRSLAPSYTLIGLCVVGLGLSGIWMAEVGYRLVGSSPLVTVAADGSVSLWKWHFQANSLTLWVIAIVTFIASLSGAVLGATRAGTEWRVINVRNEEPV